MYSIAKKGGRGIKPGPNCGFQPSGEITAHAEYRRLFPLVCSTPDKIKPRRRQLWRFFPDFLASGYRSKLYRMLDTVKIGELLINAKMQRDAALQRVIDAMRQRDNAKLVRAQQQVDDCNAIIGDLEKALRDDAE
jgi:hypothetical protein